MAQIVKHRGGQHHRRPLSGEALGLLRKLGKLQRELSSASVPVELLGIAPTQRAWGALLALLKRSLVVKSTRGGLRLTRAGWTALGGVN